MSGKARLDDVDLEVLRVLRENARLTYREIGERLGLSESTVRRRVKKLVKLGVIRRFTVEVNLEKVGPYVVSFLTVIPSAIKTERVMEELKQFDEIEEVYYTSGRCGILAKAIVKSIRDLDELIRRIRKIKGVLTVESCVILRRVK